MERDQVTTNARAGGDLENARQRPTLARLLAAGVAAAAMTLGAGCDDDAGDYGETPLTDASEGTMERADGFVDDDELDAPVAGDTGRVPPPPGADGYERGFVADGEQPARDRRGEDAIAMTTAAWTIQRSEADDGSGMTMLTVPAPDGSDGLIVRREQPTQVRAGEQLEYSIIVENVGSMAMHDIKVKEWRPQGFTVQSPEGPQAPQHQAAQDGNASTWTIDALGPGESRTIRAAGVAEQEGQIGVCMTVTYEPAICVVTDVVKPELIVRRMVEQNLAYVCEEIEVVYIVQNAGSGEARSATLTEDLPQGVVTADGQQRVSLEVPPLEAGQSSEHRVMLRANRPGEYSSFAVASSNDLQARSRETAYRFVRPQLELMVDAPAREYVGRDVPVRVTVRNTSEWPALETRLMIPALAELDRVSISSQNAEASEGGIMIGRLEPGESRTISMTFAAMDPRSHNIEVMAEAYCAEAVSDEVGIEVIGIEAVRLETIDLVDPVSVGQDTVYEVRVKNQGSAESINVNVRATLPDQMTFVGADGDTQVQANGQQLVFAPIDRLPPGEIATWRVRVRADSPGKTRLELELTSNATRRPITEQEPTTVIDAPVAPQDN